jgi:hypothetical protein
LVFGILLVFSTVFGVADVALAYDRIEWARQASDGDGIGALLYGSETGAMLALLPENKPTYAAFLLPQLFSLALVWLALFAVHKHSRSSQPAW